ncbi:voltage-gated potassium channel [Cylindrobasidium torrendii FP15055 ss-10]|uniref:Voltage-gated potassium channel n=1 Tax=Cylindrobasidium torrendii FP15055 ss-10 TaxID=1314674 RepID=A0A0D7AZR7_9AGAR|nr:voltage-gated potassium channel [Cylindrobasidium torrendii FP15055 ss-10]
MNEPELKEPIETADADVAEQAPSERKEKESWPKRTSRRWWFASTVLPMIAGTFGPIANLFSICALVQSWRLYVPPGKTLAEGTHITDPPWLLALNALSLASAIIANIFLLFNFARRIRYDIAQPITIALWYLSAVLLLVPICLTPILIIEPRETHAFSQSYYYGLISAVTYILISTLLLFNALGAYVFHAYPPSFASLTVAQRTMMLQTIAYSCYLALGAGVFSTVENWSFVDGFYWSNYTLLTVGLGSDYALKTTVGRGLLIPYAVGGIMMIGLVVSSVRQLVLERAGLRMQRARMERARKSMGAEESSLDPRQAYDRMRETERKMDAARRVVALSMSTFAFIFLWVLGALVFWYSEAPQGWTYFESLFFTYTSLLTIGYGDFYAQSSSGKPFFVIWSLMAVPTMTILISHLGDTAVVWLKSGTIWVGRRTILPGKDEAEDGEMMDALDDILEKEHLALRVLLAIRELARHADSHNHPKKYSWEEWNQFIKLCGDYAPENLWTHEDGPIFSDRTETGWLLERLSYRLEDLMKDLLPEVEENSLSASRSSS